MNKNGDEWLDEVVEEMKNSDEFDIKMIKTITSKDVKDILYDDITERFYRKGWNDCAEHIINLIKEGAMTW